MQVEIYSDKDENITIQAVITKGMKGMRNYYGKPLTPDDDDEIEIVESYDDNEQDVILTPGEYDRAIESIIQEIKR